MEVNAVYDFEGTQYAYYNYFGSVILYGGADDWWFYLLEHIYSDIFYSIEFTGVLGSFFVYGLSGIVFEFYF